MSELPDFVTELLDDEDWSFIDNPLDYGYYLSETNHNHDRARNWLEMSDNHVENTRLFLREWFRRYDEEVLNND